MIKVPFPYFGGKSKAATLIWERIGADCGNYVEPFFGSGAVWLGRPDAFAGWATVNDIDGNVCNFWRAVELDPDAVAVAADWPVSECDLHARHLWLVRNQDQLAGRLMADPDYYEPRAAGWWAAGLCAWIGGGYCDGNGSWGAVLDGDGVATFAKTDGATGTGVNRQLPHLSNAGKGVHRKLPHLGDGKGVTRQLPHLGDAGKGVHRKLPHLGDAGTGVTGLCARRRAWLVEWFCLLKDALREMRICCGDWQRIMSVGTMTRNGVCGVVLDPPYSQTRAVYANDSKTISGDVREWCIANGDNPMLRIALCGHETEHNELEELGWNVETWDKGGGYQGADDRERIWFSPACLIGKQGEFGF